MSFTRKLLAWYKRNARVLPWRQTRNPYAILVSEFMLQQTQVSRVLEYFPRFMARFPTIASLAGARPKAVMEQWRALGISISSRNTSRKPETEYRTIPRTYGHYPVSDGTQQEQSRASRMRSLSRPSIRTCAECCSELLARRMCGSSPNSWCRSRE